MCPFPRQVTPTPAIPRVIDLPLLNPVVHDVDVGKVGTERIIDPDANNAVP